MFTRKFLPILMFGIASLAFVGCSGSDDSTDTQSTEVDFTKGDFKQKILVEDITSASCMWCPLGTVAIEGLENSEYKDRVIGVGVHGDYNAQMVKDPYVLSGMTKLMSALKLSGWPFVAFNRDTKIKGTAFQSFLSETATRVYEFSPAKFETFQKKYTLLNEGSPIGIKIESNLAATSGTVNVSLKFSTNINQELKYVVYILEDGLVFKQANATAMFGNNSGQPAWANDFVHDHVVRATNNFLGEAIAAGQTTTNEFKATAELTYDTVNLENASVVVAVLDKDGKVVNAQKAKANTTQDYEMK